MADFPALPLFTDAYLADCGYFSDAEHGRYLRLLMRLWQSPDCYLPGLNERIPDFFELYDGRLTPLCLAQRHVIWTDHPSRLLNSTWRKIRQAFLAANELLCVYCGTVSAVHWEVDHIIPRARGGTHAWHNLAVACRDCNRSKGAR